MASKLLNLVALSSLAIMAVSFGPASTNALSTGHAHLNRHIEHAPIAKKKRESKRCKVRSSSVPVPTPSSKAPEPAPTTQEEPAPITKAASTTVKDEPKTTSKPKPTSQAADPAPTKSTGGGAPGNAQFGQKGSKICAAWGNGNDDKVLKAFKTDHVVGYVSGLNQDT